MTTAAIPAARRAGVRLRRLAAAADRFVRAGRPAAVNLAKLPLTAAGLACMDFAAFHLAHGWGWLVTGVSLVVLEHLIADED